MSMTLRVTADHDPQHQIDLLCQKTGIPVMTKATTVRLVEVFCQSGQEERVLEQANALGMDYEVVDAESTEAGE